MNWILLIGSILAAGFLIVLQPAYSCNEAVCASIVSKCMLTQSCKCDLKNCTCCKECSNCLSFLYTECCSCVEMCPKPNDTDSSLSKTSNVEDLKESIEGLFKALTTEPDIDERWIIYTYPINFDISHFSPTVRESIIQNVESSEVTVNCTVAFMTQCMSWNKCKKSCQSMGASSYRWFHDGCCECVGNTCINYGINESRCPNCNESEDTDDIDDENYGDFDESKSQEL